MAIFYEFKFFGWDDEGRYTYRRFINVDHIISIFKRSKHPKEPGAFYMIMTYEPMEHTRWAECVHQLKPDEFDKFVAFLRKNGSIVQFYDRDDDPAYRGVSYDPRTGRD